MATHEFTEDDAPTRAPLTTRTTWLIGIGLAALTGVTAWLGWGTVDQPVRWQEVGFAIVSPTEASVTYDVFLYGDAGATCRVQALNVRFAEVGVTTARVDPANGMQQRITTTMVTTEEATTAVVDSCETE